MNSLIGISNPTRKVSLSRAHIIEKRIKKLIAEASDKIAEAVSFELPLDLRLHLLKGGEVSFSEQASQATRFISDLQDLINARFAIREAIQTANAKHGVQSAMLRIAHNNSILGTLTQVQAIAVPSYGSYMVSVGDLHATIKVLAEESKSASENARFRKDIVKDVPKNVALLGNAEISELDAKIKAIRSEINSLNDTIAETNAKIKISITLPDKIWEAIS